MRWFEPRLPDIDGRAGHLTRSVAWRVMVGALCATPLISGCSGQAEKPTVEEPQAIVRGNLQLALIGVAPSGTSYRLRDGLFTITALDRDFETYVSTEEDPDASYLYLELAAGEYEVYLNPGYTVEAVSGVGMAPPPMGTVPIPGPTMTVPDLDAGAPVETATQISVSPAPPGASGRVLDLSNLGRFKRKVTRADMDGGVDEPPPDVTPPVEPPPPTGADGGTTPLVELLSPNPATVRIYSDSYSEVRFAFRINGTIVGTGDGALIIGVDFYDNQSQSACGADDDPYEPNNDFYSAASIPTDTPTTAFACTDDVDVFRFDAPVPAGQAFAVQLAFDGSLSDIDMELGTADGMYVGGSYGVGDSESITTLSYGGGYLLVIYNLGPQSSSYEISFNTDIQVELSNCCTTSQFPGCTDDAVQQCVCDLDSYCCQYSWDEYCSMEAIQDCGDSCTGDADCCEGGEGAGCNVPEVNLCVCQLDIACCTSSYDKTCAQEAVAECGAQCSLPAPTSDCCEATAEAGCVDSTVQECVCGIDPTCCTSTFDQNCVGLAQGQCGASCGGSDQ